MEAAAPNYNGTLGVAEHVFGSGAHAKTRGVAPVVDTHDYQGCGDVCRLLNDGRASLAGLDYFSLQGQHSGQGQVLNLRQSFFAPEDLLTDFGVQGVLQLHFYDVDGVDSPATTLDEGAGQFQHLLIAVGAVDGEENSMLVFQG